jgi:hypothetical protein
MACARSGGVSTPEPRALHRVTGTVIDPRDGAPLVGAEVYLDAASRPTRVDSSGRFSLPITDTLRHAVHILREGYSTLTVPFALEAGHDHGMVVVLSPVDSAFRARTCRSVLLVIYAPPDSTRVAISDTTTFPKDTKDFDPATIWSVEVLHGVPGMRVYGAAAINGVIEIVLNRRPPN